MTTHLLFESASGYTLYELLAVDEIGQSLDAVQQSVTSLEKFSKMVKLSAFKPFGSAADALEQVNAISESQLTDELKAFLEMNLPKVKKDSKKKAKVNIGVAEAKLGSLINEQLGYPCVCNSLVGEMMRGLRLHSPRFLKQLEESDMAKAQLGLAHSYSRAKVKFNVNRQDNMIIQAIALLDTLDKDVNTFVMRMREWYSWHFPELVKLVPDATEYSRTALLIKDRSDFGEEKRADLVDILKEDERAEAVYEASRTSMGQDISPIDLINIETFAKRVISLSEYRHELHSYLLQRMHIIAPNLSALIGEIVGARLISHAGSLTNLAKYPASTVQILGAEKALFRALKTRGNTPKYGLIFHSSFIGRAKLRNKGRISRYLANKCSIASRIDCFMDISTSAFGEKLKEQVEERLRFYEDGVAPTKNSTAMHAAMEGLAAQGLSHADLEAQEDAEEDADDQGVKSKSKKKKKKGKTEPEATAAADVLTNGAAAADDGGKKKKKKKRPAEDGDASNATAEVPVLTEKTKKKKAADGAVAEAVNGTAKPAKKKKRKTED